MKNGHFDVCLRDETCRCEVRQYWIIFAITLITLLAEVFGGIISGSLALLSDAFHVGIDLGSVAISIVVAYKIRNQDKGKEDAVRSWGGVISGSLLAIAVGLIAAEGWERLKYPKPILSEEMLVFSIIGLIGNAIALWVMHENEEDHITHKALVKHILSDLIQSVGVVMVGIAIFFTGWAIIDPISSFVIALLLLRLSYGIFKDVFFKKP